jgi:hypothetical protein
VIALTTAEKCTKQKQKSLAVNTTKTESQVSDKLNMEYKKSATEGKDWRKTCLNTAHFEGKSRNKQTTTKQKSSPRVI